MQALEGVPGTESGGLARVPDVQEMTGRDMGGRGAWVHGTGRSGQGGMRGLQMAVCEGGRGG